MYFLDNASTTQVLKEVNDEISYYNLNEFYNPSAVYDCSTNISKKMFDKKKYLAEILNVKDENIVFTSGATEGNNLIIKGLLTNNKNAEFLFSLGEHPSVYNVAKYLQTNGYKVDFIKLQNDGTIDFEDYKSKVNSNTYFISVIHVSNETGAINDIKKLSDYAKKVNPNLIFHADGVQAFCKIPVNLKELNVDAYTVSAHKFHGPKGVGFVYIKNLNKLKSQILGGGQQNNFRSGTENVPGIFGMVKAVEISQTNLKTNYDKVLSYRNFVKEELLKNISNIKINECDNNSPYILSASIEGIKGEVLLHMLDKKGVCISTGSACSSKNANNRMLQSCGASKKEIEGNIRISFTDLLSFDDVKQATKIIIEEIAKLKAMIGVN